MIVDIGMLSHTLEKLADGWLADEAQPFCLDKEKQKGGINGTDSSMWMH